MAINNLKHGQFRLSFCVGIALAFMILFVYLRPIYVNPLGAALEHQVCKTVGQHGSATSPPSASHEAQGVLSHPAPAISRPAPAMSHFDPDWTFNATRDERVFGLSLEQCDASFPMLFNEINRATQYQLRRQNKVTPEDLDISWAEHGLVRAMIVDQQVRYFSSSIFAL